MPSRPCVAGRRLQVAAVAGDVVGHLPVRALQLQALQELTPVRVGQGHDGVPVEPEQVEDDVGDRRLLGEPLRLGLGRDVHPVLEPAEARTALVVERDDLAVEDRAVRAQRAVEAVQLGIALRDVVAAARLQPQAAGLGVGERADAVPLHLEGPALRVRRQVREPGEHRDDLLRHRLAVRILRRIHPVDHPVLAGRLALALVQREEPVAAAEALAVERHLDLGVVELVRLVDAAVPDPHRAGAVAPLRDVALPLEVLERVILGVDRHAVVLRVLGDPVRDRPGDGDAVVLQAQVPVQPGRVVLLHDEPGEGFALPWRCGAGRRSPGVPPGSGVAF